MRETLLLSSITSSCCSGSGPPSLQCTSLEVAISSDDGLPCILRISSHHLLTLSSFEKKRWPPISMRLPSWLTVRDIPPILSLCSSITTSYSSEFLSSSQPTVIPAGPAPMITAFFFILSSIIQTK